MTTEVRQAQAAAQTEPVYDGRYAIVRQLGRGGMGAVFEARDLRLDRRVAIKVLSKGAASDDAARRRFSREAKAVVGIDHPNVVKVLDYGDQPTPFLVMEFLEGEDLLAVLRRRKRLEWPIAQEIFVQIAAGLAAAHEYGVVHRDIKPANVFLVHCLDGSTRVKVLDFGIAKVQPQVGASGVLTGTDQVVGTATYMAPEQARGQPVDGRTDVYAVGVMLFRTLTGRLPFRSKNLYEVLDAHVRTPPPRPRALVATISPQVESVILRALQKAPEDRFQTIRELAATLEFTDPTPEIAKAGWMARQRAHLEVAPEGSDPAPATKTLDPEPGFGRPPPVPTTTLAGPPQPTAILPAQTAKDPLVAAVEGAWLDETHPREGAVAADLAVPRWGLAPDPGGSKPNALARGRGLVIMATAAVLTLLSAGVLWGLLGQDTPPPAENPATVVPSTLASAPKPRPVSPRGPPPEPPPSPRDGFQTAPSPMDAEPSSDDFALQPAVAMQPEVAIEPRVRTTKPRRAQRSRGPRTTPQPPNSSGTPAVVGLQNDDSRALHEVRQAIEKHCGAAIVGKTLQVRFQIAPTGQAMLIRPAPPNEQTSAGRCARRLIRGQVFLPGAKVRRRRIDIRL